MVTGKGVNGLFIEVYSLFLYYKEYRKRSYVCLIWFYWLTETSLAVVKWWTFVPVWAASEAIALLQVVTLARFLIAVALAVTDGYEFAWVCQLFSLIYGKLLLLFLNYHFVISCCVTFRHERNVKGAWLILIMANFQNAILSIRL